MMLRNLHLKFFTFSSVVITLLFAGCSSERTPYLDTFLDSTRILEHVDPFIGTGGHGHTFPGATFPFGMVQCSPQTRLSGWDGCSGYHDSDSMLYGFAHTALSGTGVSDYGDVLLLPYLMNDPPDTTQDGQYIVAFDKGSEQASPGYYAVTLLQGIKAEFTATERAGIHRYTFPVQTQPVVLVDLRYRDALLSHGFEMLNDSTLVGSRISCAWAQEQHVYFALRSSKPFTLEWLSKDSSRLALHFGDHDATPLVLKVGLSAVSTAGALGNLMAETDGQGFATLHEAARDRWLAELSKVRIRTTQRDDATNFYTALYHTFLAPNLYNDVDGRYRGMDLAVHQLPRGESHYTVFSLWDTYRATHPLFTLLQPQRNQAFIRTLLRQYTDGGILPIWELAANYTGCMIGYHAIPVIWDAYQKGQRDFDANLALEAMVHSAEQSHRGLDSYRELGFIPADLEAESVSKTLEYAYDDWCIARMGEALNDQDIHEEFQTRACNWRNVFDPETGFMRGRANGGWVMPFDPREVNFHYTEANAWQYRFAVPHDMNTLIDRLGGSERFSCELQKLFTSNTETTGREQADITGRIGQYAHGNEPSHHVAYLHAYAGEVWRTQERVHEIMDALYRPTPDGLSGNEDCGQMSAWYVFSAMGFYPVCPGEGQYVLGSPRFEEMAIQLENGREFRIVAAEAAAGKRYIQALDLNGNQHTSATLTHEQIETGGILTVQLQNTPNTEFARDPDDRPVSRVAYDPVQPPFARHAPRSFIESDSLVLAAHDPAVAIWYQWNGEDAPSASETQIYKGAIPLTETGSISFWAERGSLVSSRLTTHFKEIPSGKTIRFDWEPREDEVAPYAGQYSAGGDRALIDGIMGKGDYRSGTWQGYQGRDLHATVDLGKERRMSTLSIRFLQDENSWIFMPDSVIISVSRDGREYRTLGQLVPRTKKRDKGTLTERFSVNAPTVPMRYVQVIGRNLVNCPTWHKSAGGDCWIFADEIVIE